MNTKKLLQRRRQRQKQSNTLRRKKKKGGKVIGEGKDGIIFEISSRSDYVAKVFNRHVEINHELQHKLKEIDPEEKRFSQYIFPDSSLRKEIKGNSEFSKVKKAIGSLSNADEIVFLKKLTPIKDPQKLTKKQYRYLKASLEILHKHKISHGDLPDNVMLDPSTDNPIIIDWENAQLNSDDIWLRMDQQAFFDHFKALKPNADNNNSKTRKNSKTHSL